MKQFLATLLLACMAQVGWAQLPDGTISPDFTATDLNGQEHNLYSLLDSGYQVILDFSATWCPPCWTYHTSGVLDELYETHGPAGTNTLRVFFIEGDDNTTQADLEGTTTNSQGDWIAGTSYPIIDNAGNIFDDFGCTYFPTIYTVCPNKILTETGQASLAVHENVLNSAICAPASSSNDALLMDYAGPASTCGDNPAALSVRLMNNGLDTLTACTIQVSKLLPFNQTEVLGSTDWQGELGTYDYTTVDLLDAAVDGINTFVFEVISTDDNDGNNAVEGTVLGSEEVANNLEVRMKTDGAPEELGWSITDQTGTIVASALPGSENLESTTEYVWDVTLPELGCYTFTLLDEGGDGLFNLATSLDGVGFVEVNSTDGETILDQDWFYQELDAFSEVTFDMEVTEVTSVAEQGAISQMALFPNPAWSDVTLDMSVPRTSDVQVVVMDLTGQIVMTTDLGTLASGNHKHLIRVGDMVPGTYLVEVRAGQHRQTTILIRQ